MPAANFLAALYRMPGIKADFDGVALHPYAVDTETLEELVEGMREVIARKPRPGAGLYITEMGWGSQNDFHQVAFEQGIRARSRELRDAYGYLLENRAASTSSRSTGSPGRTSRNPATSATRSASSAAASGFKPKPAWHAFVAITGGLPRP